jgi:hypothetical protein
MHGEGSKGRDPGLAMLQFRIMDLSGSSGSIRSFVCGYFAGELKIDEIAPALELFSSCLLLYITCLF